MMNELDKFLNIDVEKIPEADVSNFEKKKMKKRILGQKRQSPWILKLAVAAFLLIGVSATTIVAFPSVASQIPILQNIVSYFDDDELTFGHFSEVAQPLDLTQTSNGSTITIEEAVYDGTSVTVSFALKTETDLGDMPFSEGIIEASRANGYGASTQMEKVSDNIYAGLITMAPDFGNNPPNSLKLSWEPIAFEDSSQLGNKLTGDWSFDFKLQALDSKPVKIDQTIGFEGGTYILNDLSLTKLSTVLRFDTENIDENHYVNSWELTDDLGNVYPMQFGTGSSSLGRSYQQMTFEALNPEATSVTITPIITYIEDYEDKGMEMKASSVTVELE